MIRNLRLLRAIGQFDYVDSASAVDLRKLTLVYAENARGKTTLAAVLRHSLPATQSRSPNGDASAPHMHPRRPSSAPVGQALRASAMALGRARALNVLVFDNFFVNRNVYSGMDVDPEHRQNLHDLILGETGVALAQRVEQLARQIRSYNADMRIKADAIPTADRLGLSADEFCSLAARVDIDDAIRSAEQRLSAIQNADAVQSTPQFTALSLPVAGFAGIRDLLGRTVADLDNRAVDAVTAHFAALGDRAEVWIQTGMTLGTQSTQLAKDQPCPFCGQSLRGSPVFDHYRAYFGQAYTELQEELATAESRIASTFSGDALASFQQEIQTAEDRRRFWARFTTVPEVGINVTILAAAWQQARDAVLDALRAKRADPLTAAVIGADTQNKIDVYQAIAARVNTSSTALVAANAAVQRVKVSAQAQTPATAQAELNRLRATKARHTPETTSLCNAYLAEKAARDAAQIQKVLAQQQLDAHRAAALPNWETAVSAYLSRLGTEFTVARIQSQPTGGRPSCVYRLVINGHAVAVGPGAAPPGSPTFKNTLTPATVTHLRWRSSWPHWTTILAAQTGSSCSMTPCRVSTSTVG